MLSDGPIFLRCVKGKGGEDELLTRLSKPMLNVSLDYGL